MTYLLDTSTCVGILRGRAPKARARLDQLGKNECAICSIVLLELRAGALKSQNPIRETAKVDEFLREMNSFQFDDECANLASEIRGNLEKRGVPIGPFDLLIAGIARRHGSIVVTRNIGEFSRVPNLHVEDWELEP